MARFLVTGDQYRTIDARMSELKRQLNQKGGSPLDPETLARELQRLVEGRLSAPPEVSYITRVSYNDLPDIKGLRWSDPYLPRCELEVIKACREVPRHPCRLGFEILHGGDLNWPDDFEEWPDHDARELEIALSEIDRLGYRPALPEELLWFVAHEPASLQYAGLRALGALRRGADEEPYFLTLCYRDEDGLRPGEKMVWWREAFFSPIDLWECGSVLVTPK